MTIKSIILSSFLVFSFFGLNAQNELTLEKVISIAMENNYGIKISDEFIRIAENNDTWGRAGRYPTVNLNGNFTNTFINDNNPASFIQGVFYTGSLGTSAEAQWVLYAGGRVKILKEQLGTAVQQQILLKDQEIHTLMRTLVQQYYNILFQQQQLDLFTQNLDVSADRLSYEEARREFGASNSFNILQFENAVITDSTNVVSQLQNIEIAKRNLYNSMDMNGTGDYSFSEELAVQVQDIDREKLRKIMMESNYTLKSLEVIAALNRLNTKLEKANRKPTISLNGSTGFAENAFQIFDDNPMTGEPFGLLFSNRLSGSVSAVASYNLYDGGVRKTNVENARIQEDIDAISVLEAQAEISNQLDILIDNYKNQQALLDLADQQYGISQKNLEITEERFKAGQITSLDYRNIQSQNLAAAFAKVSAIYNLLLTKSEIDFLVGRYQ